MSNGTYKYTFKLAIDSGNTNTVMYWRLFENLPNGRKKEITPDDNIYSIPSIMVLREENREIEFKNCNEYYGKEAEDTIDNNTLPKIQSNFKKRFYMAQKNSSEFAEAETLYKRFFTCLRREYYTRIWTRAVKQAIGADGLDTVHGTLYLTYPVRADFDHIKRMVKIAEEAGFTKEIGIHEISRERNEADCIVHYAVGQDSMKDLQKNADQKGGLNVLYADIGGSTGDIALDRFCIDEAGVRKSENIAWWPSLDEKRLLGGSEVDEQILQYLIREGHAVEEYAKKQFNKRSGQEIIRKFKEENNSFLKRGDKIERLGNLARVCFDQDDYDVLPKKMYKHGRKIDSEIFEREICREYIGDFLSALDKLFDYAYQKSHNKVTCPEEHVHPEDVDAIILFGGGSRLYFLEDLLTGKLAERYPDDPILGRDPGFAKIRENPELLLSDWEDPSKCCALGALTENENYIRRPVANADYWVRIYLTSESGFVVYYDYDKLLVKKGCELPTRVMLLDNENIKVEDDRKYFVVHVNCYRIDDPGEKQQVGSWKIETSGRSDLAQGLYELRYGADLLLLPYAFVADLAVEAVLSCLGKDTDDSEPFFMSHLLKDRISNASICANANIGTDRTANIKIILHHKRYNMDQRINIEL